MKRMITISLTVTMVLLAINASLLKAQNNHLTGTLVDERSGLPVAFASIGLLSLPDSVYCKGTVSDENGSFSMGNLKQGHYRFLVSIIGYTPESKRIEVPDGGETNLGIVYLKETATILKETVITGERLRAKSENGRTTFSMTRKIQDASGTAMDVLKFIPGVQVDMKQNITLEGSRDVQILIDGKEYDKSYINRLSPEQIDRIEIISTPASNVDGNITGAINIILKKEKESGMSGQVFAEIPTSNSEMFLFPAFNLNYGYKKMNLFTSYNGGINFENITESNLRMITGNSDTTRIASDQYVRQKNLLHKFHYGLDYFLGSHDQFNFYGFFSTSSYEQDGDVSTRISGASETEWNAEKEETDRNNGLFNSLFYKHLFNDKGHEIKMEISNFKMNASNNTTFIQRTGEYVNQLLSNQVDPHETATMVKIDYTYPVQDKFKINLGTKAKSETMGAKGTNFKYSENTWAFYGTADYHNPRFDFSSGFRIENSVSGLKENFKNSVFSLLPYATMRFKTGTGQHVKLTYNRTVNRPDIYRLNPYSVIDDPYSIRKGNSFLRSEFRTNISIEYSRQFGSNFFSTRLYYQKISQAFGNLLLVNDTGAFETQPQNLGTIHQYGTQVSGSVRIGIATFNPYVRLFDVFTQGNSLAVRNNISDRHDLVLETGLSTILSFRKEFAVSLILQYATPKNNIQDNYYCGTLYFISMEKTFKNKMKAGFMSALPLTGSFVYQGSEIKSPGFYSRYEGHLKLSAFPLWLRFTYPFKTGKTRITIDRDKEEITSRPKKGM